MKLGEIDPTHVIESAVRLGMIAVLIFAGLRIVAPVLELMAWGIILAVALGPSHLWLMRRLGDSGRDRAHARVGLLELAGSIFVAGFLLAKRDLSAQDGSVQGTGRANL
jgi:predicted PurR-regulated permease PerM